MNPPAVHKGNYNSEIFKPILLSKALSAESRVSSNSLKLLSQLNEEGTLVVLEKILNSTDRLSINLLKALAKHGGDAKYLLPKIDALYQKQSNTYGSSMDAKLLEFMNLINLIKNDKKYIDQNINENIFLVSSTNRGNTQTNQPTINPNLLANDSNQNAQTTQPTNQVTQETTPQQITTDSTQEKTTNWIIYVLAAVVLLVILIVLKLKKNHTTRQKIG